MHIIWKALAFITVCSFGLNAHSAIKITAINGASRIDGFGAQTNTTIEIFAGAYGSETSTACNGLGSTTFCNTCDATTTACNTKAIHAALTLNITFQSDSIPDGTNHYPVAYLKQTTLNKLDLENNSEATLVTKNTPTTISITWNEICTTWNDGTARTNCKFNADTTLGIGFTTVQGSETNLADSLETVRILVQGDPTFGDPMNTSASQDYCSNTTSIGQRRGACNFTIFPGDEKVFVENVKVVSGFPSQGTDVNINSIRIYRSEVSFADITVESPASDLAIAPTSSNNTATMESNTIEGLKNNTKYFFKMATLDEANNVHFFTGFSTPDTDDVSNTCFEGSEIPLCHQGTPEPVLGLLEDEFDCFIATASFGTPFEKQVVDFRAFRSQYLRHSYLGRKFIKFYYQNSPPIAHWIKQNPSIKPLVRLLLWPLWIFAKLCLQYGHFAFLGLFGLLLGVFFFKFRKRRTRRA